MRFAAYNKSVLEGLEQNNQITHRGNLKIHVREGRYEGYVIVKIWRGRASNPYANYQFNSAEKALTFIEKEVEKDAKHTERKQRQKDERKRQIEEQRNKIKVGTILVNSWGYDQTNVNAYQVTDRAKASVILRRIRLKTTPGSKGFMSDSRKPIPNSLYGEPFVKRITAAGVSFDHGGCSIWDGESDYYCSWYA